MHQRRRGRTATFLEFLAGTTGARLVASDLGGTQRLAPQRTHAWGTPVGGNHLERSGELPEDPLAHLGRELALNLRWGVAAQCQYRHDQLVGPAVIEDRGPGTPAHLDAIDETIGPLLARQRDPEVVDQRAVLGIRQPAVGDRIPVLSEQLENVPRLLLAVPVRTIPTVSSPDR